MPARRYEPTDLIPVNFVPALIYGPPSIGKTTLGQSCESPVTLDFDVGAHRAMVRKTVYQFDAWTEVLDEMKAGTFDAYKTIVVDTGGRAIESIMREVIRDSPAKNPWAYKGVLTPTGYGELGRRFRSWLDQLRQMKKELLFVCHEDSSKDDSGSMEAYPELPGSMAWKEIHKSFDVIGHLYWDGNKRRLDFSPREGFKCCKNPGAFFKPEEIPDHFSPTFNTYMSTILAAAKAVVGKTAEASASLAQHLDDWMGFLSEMPAADAVSKRMAEDLPKLSGSIKAQVWAIIGDHAKERGWTFDKATKSYVDPTAKTEPANDAEPTDDVGDAHEG